MRLNMIAGKLRFTTDMAEGVQEADLVIIALGTPLLPTGRADRSFVEKAMRQVALAMNGYLVVAVKSTVPVGTNAKVKQWMANAAKHPFDVVSVPEFLREGSAVKDTLHPYRIIIGSDSEQASALLLELHRPLSDQVLLTDMFGRLPPWRSRQGCLKWEQCLESMIR